LSLKNSKGHVIFLKFPFQDLTKYNKEGILGIQIYHLATLLKVSFVALNEEYLPTYVFCETVFFFCPQPCPRVSHREEIGGKYDHESPCTFISVPGVNAKITIF
jgi:hypothetical protein